MALYCGRRRSGHLFNLLRKGCSCLASSLAPNSTELAAIQVPSSIKSLSVSALDGGLSGGHRRLGVVRAAQSWFRSSVRERERKQKGDCAWKQEFGQRKKRRRRRREKFRGGGEGKKVTLYFETHRNSHLEARRADSVLSEQQSDSQFMNQYFGDYDELLKRVSQTLELLEHYAPYRNVGSSFFQSRKNTCRANHSTRALFR